MMKRLHSNQMLLTIAVVAAFSLIACRKNAEDALSLLTATEAAEIIETSVSARTAGATMPVEEIVVLLENSLGDCGIPGDTTLQRSSNAGPVSYQYSFGLGWIIHCNNLGVPQNAEITIEGGGSFTAPRWSGADNTDGALTCTGLNPSATAYVFNGTYALDGSLTGQLRNIDPTLSVTAAITLIDLSIRKSDRYITGGTGTIVLTATNARGRSETIKGNLVFNGDGTATVTVNGYSHTFSI